MHSILWTEHYFYTNIISIQTCIQNSTIWYRFVRSLQDKHHNVHTVCTYICIIYRHMSHMHAYTHTITRHIHHSMCMSGIGLELSFCSDLDQQKLCKKDLGYNI